MAKNCTQIHLKNKGLVMLALIVFLTMVATINVSFAASLPVVQFENTSVSVKENQPFSLIITTSGYTGAIKVKMSTTDAGIDCINTKMQFASQTLVGMGQANIIYETPGSWSNTTAKPNASTRYFYVTSSSTTLFFGGNYKSTKGSRTVTLTLEPSTDNTYALGANKTITITFQDVDGARPDSQVGYTKEQYVAACANWLNTKYPTGSYWDHMIGTVNDDDCVSLVGCNENIHLENNGVRSTSWCNGSYSFGLGVRICNANEKYPSSQCMGFALKVAEDVFGSNPKNGSGWTVYNSYSSAGGFQAGDYVRISGHSFFVTSVSGSNVNTIECNYTWSGVKNRCRIFRAGDGQDPFRSRTIASVSGQVEEIRRYNYKMKLDPVANLKVAESENGIILTWDRSMMANGYVVQRYEEGNRTLREAIFGAKVTVDSAKTEWQNVPNSYVDNTTQPGKTYTYLVYAILNSAAETNGIDYKLRVATSEKAEIMITTKEGEKTDSEIELKPVENLAVTEGNGGITLRWDRSMLANGYIVQRFEGTTQNWRKAIFGSKVSIVSAYTEWKNVPNGLFDSEIQPGKTYTYQVYAILNSAAETNGYDASLRIATSEKAEITVTTKASAQTTEQITQKPIVWITSQTSSAITLQWGAVANAVSYNVYAYTASNQTTPSGSVKNAADGAATSVTLSRSQLGIGTVGGTYHIILEAVGTANSMKSDHLIVNIYNTSDTKGYVYKYLTETMKFNSAAACAVMANIEKESGFNPNCTYTEADGQVSIGLCQWNGGRRTNLETFCANNNLNYLSVEGQMRFLEEELKSSKTAVYNFLKAVPNNSQGAYDGAFYWCFYYEVPANRNATGTTRGNLAATTYWNTYGTAASSGYIKDGKIACMYLSDYTSADNIKLNLHINSTSQSTNVGVKFGETRDNLTTLCTDPTVAANGNAFYGIKKYFGVPASGKTYYFQFFYTNGGVNYTSKVYQFTFGSNVITEAKDAPAVTPTSVSISPVSITGSIGVESRLTATVLPTNAANKTVTWTSSDPTVATVDANGVVIGQSAGTAVITAVTSNGLTSACLVIIEEDVVIVPKMLLLNFVVDGQPELTLDQVAQMNVYINGELDAEGVTSYNGEFIGDFTYEIQLLSLAEGKRYVGIDGGELLGTVTDDLKILTLYFQTEETDVDGWQIISEDELASLEGDYEIEYRHTYTEQARTTPGDDWVMIQAGDIQYENDGKQYKADDEKPTAAKYHLIGYYYFHWCNDGVNANYYKKDYLPIRHEISMDSVKDFTVTEKGTDGDGSGRKYYYLTHLTGEWKGGIAKCGPNGSRVYYRGAVYQNLKPYRVNLYEKVGNWTNELDTSASKIEYRVRWKRTAMLKLPDGVRTIEAEAFAGVSATVIRVPFGCAIIGSKAFANCPDLTKIYIPETVSSIALDAFDGCPNLTIYAPAGSTAIKVAKYNDIPYVEE